MSFSLYEVSIPVFLRHLKTTATLLQKALDHTSNEEGQLLASRLVGDMGALPFQVQRLSDAAKGVAVRAAKADVGPWADEESTFAELQARIQKTIDLLETLDPKSMDGVENDEVTFAGRTSKVGDYVFKFAVPNFYFHFVTIYGLLRKEGVPIGKLDYLGAR